MTKLADFGLSHFQEKTGTNALGLDAQGTRVYGKEKRIYARKIVQVLSTSRCPGVLLL